MQLREKMETLIEEMLNGKILLDEAISEFERIYIEKALNRHNEHFSNTAVSLGIHRNTLSKKLSNYQAENQKNIKLLKNSVRKKL